MKREESDQQDSGAQSSQDGLPWKLIALAVIVAGLAVFFFQNGDKASVDFLLWGGQWPVWLVIGISVIIGAVIDRLASWQWNRSRRRE